ncbi:MAG TPA: HIT domain-containing protein [Rubricoccaceae bacterium]|nr:HIT domain-containing protein [Rubricoccaceae bacterium]
MDRLWSPWRGAHVERATEAARTGADEGLSVFARIAAEPAHDAEHFVVWRGATFYVVLNLYPYTNGHLLLVPYREVDAYDALTDAEHVELARLLARAMGWLREALRPDGFNVGLNQGTAAGAGIPRHLHVHLVPRWHADTNFMPVTGEVRVMHEALGATYARLRAVVEQEASGAGSPGSPSAP